MHTMCLPVVPALSDVYAGADVQAVMGLLANMGRYTNFIKCSHIGTGVFNIL